MNKAQRWMPRFIYLPLAAVPFIYLVVMVIRYGVDVPYLDGWEVVPLLEKLNHHTLTLRDLWIQHNEHRLIFPQIIMLVLAKLTSWNTFYELGASLVFALGTFLVLAKQTETTGEAIGNRWVAVVLPAVAVLVFSFRQLENWLWDWQLQMFLNALAIVGSIYLLGNPPFKRWRLAASMCLAIVAVYSFANGMLIWPIGVFVLAFAPFYKGKLRWQCLGVWLAVGAITAASYLYHYQKPPEHPDLNFILKSFVTYVHYVLSYLGGPASSTLMGSRKAGIFIAILTPVLVFALVRLRYVRFGLLVPYVGICLYVFGSALVTALGRAGFGVQQAVQSTRYNTYCELLWSCNLVFLMLLALGRKPAEERPTTKKRKYHKPEGRNPLQAVAGMIAVVLMIGMFVYTGEASLRDVETMGLYSVMLLEGRNQVVRMLNWTEPSQYEKRIILYRGDRIPSMIARAKIMADEHWSLFRHGIPEATAPPAAEPPQ